MQDLVFTQLSIPEVRQLFREEIENFFKANPIQPKTEADEIGGIELAMEITGKAKPTIYNLASKSEIPHFKKNKKLYFSRNELIRWIQGGKRKTQSEITADARAYN